MRNDRYVPSVHAILQSGNLFVYTMNNPVRWSDPTGLFAVCPVTIWNAAKKVLKAAKPYVEPAVKWVQVETVKAGRTLKEYMVTRPGNWLERQVAILFGGGGSHTPLLDQAKRIHQTTATARTANAANFRHNLINFTGQDGVGMRAHHVLPQQFRAEFRQAFSGTNLTIDHPMFGSWVPTATHQSFQWHSQYNQLWSDFFKSTGNPTAEQVLKFAVELARDFGFNLNF